MRDRLGSFARAALLPIVVLVVAETNTVPQCRADGLAQGFVAPPASARPWVYWFPLDGNLSREGITADLEAMQRVGIGGVLYMETAQGTPTGSVPFAGPAWRELIQHACREASRLGLEVNMNNDAGWCGSGGPWITPELSMQRVVWSEMEISGPRHFAGKITSSKPNRDYYRDIALFAFPTPSQKFTIPRIRGKSAAAREDVLLRTDYPALPREAVIASSSIVDLSDRLGGDGQLVWDVPAGAWTLLRVGHTTTGKDNHPAPLAGRGLECDKLSKEAAEIHFQNLMGKLIDDNREVAGQGKTLVATHIDSWEVGSQNWTPRFRQEFIRLRGYDPRPWLPAMTGRVVENVEVSERFLWDVRRTVADLLLTNYAEHMGMLARKRGLRLSIEAYGDGPLDDLPFAGRADEPMAEFWSWNKFGAAESCTEMASAAHVYGKSILGAEAFTATNAEKWLGHPGNLKELGDWAFCEGINRFVFHRYALQPWRDVRPGVSMGPWGLHYERTQTWWEQSRGWHQYLARCQYLLQQCKFVADLCFLIPENAPQHFRSPVKKGHDRPGYNFDGCPAEVVLEKMQTRDGQLVLPDGMSYRMLVLPRVGTMTPGLLKKVHTLVQAGATVLGNPPAKSPSLVGYPQCDAEVAMLAGQLWGKGNVPAELTERACGKGKVIWGQALAPHAAPPYLAESGVQGAKWVWFAEGRPERSAPPGTRYFRRTFTLPTGVKVSSARLTITADNTFECWINGRKATQGDRFQQLHVAGIGHLLKAGANVVAVAAVNTTDHPNPAGLIAMLRVELADGRKIAIGSDDSWQAGQIAEGPWKTNAGDSTWPAALVLGPLGMGPWGELEEPAPGADTTVDIDLAAHVLAKQGLVPDFACQAGGDEGGLRYIHKRTAEADIYFVANKDALPREWVCSFRIAGKEPEIWRPDSGTIEPAVAYESDSGSTRVPLRFEPYGSLFVVFRHPMPKASPVVALERNGERLLPLTNRVVQATVRKAVYGIPDDPARSRDVTAEAQATLAHGATSFAVVEMAKAGDPAYGDVKTLTIEYEAGGQNLAVSATDGQVIHLAMPAAEEAAELHRAGEGVVVEAKQPGRFTWKTSGGRSFSAEAKLPPALELAGPWEVRFAPNLGAPARVTLPALISWSEHSDAGVKYFSGTATYTKSFDVPAAMLGVDRRVCLDLGDVAVMAEVQLNGQAFDVLWKKPFVLDVTKATRPGANTLEVRVVNLWINRMIGDEQLPDDSPRQDGITLKQWPDWLLAGKPSPTGRYTFTSHRLWKKDDPLAVSGLLGPVRLRASQMLRPAGESQ